MLDLVIVEDEEIIRRYYIGLCEQRKGQVSDDEVYKLELLMKQAGLSLGDRRVTGPALEKEKETGQPAAAVELPDGQIVTGKTSELLGCCSAMLLNALKVLGGIDDERELISPSIIEPIQSLKVNNLGGHNPRLHMEEVLIALSICAVTDPEAKKALDQIPKLYGCETHCTVIVSDVDVNPCRKLGLRLTNEPVYQEKKLYHV